MMKTTRNQSGFTIIELIIATAIFSVVLLLCVFGLIRIGNLYYKGVISSRTQTVARTVSDDVVQSIQFGGEQIIPDAGTVAPPSSYSAAAVTNTIDVGNHRYTYTLDRTLTDGTIDTTTQANQVLMVQNLDSNHNLTGTPRELLAKGMMLGAFSITKSGSLYNVNVEVLSGQLDQVVDQNNYKYSDVSNFNPSTVLRCASGPGSQYCASSNLYTSAYRRL